jgi:hypothetical protein
LAETNHAAATIRKIPAALVSRNIIWVAWFLAV